MERQIEQATYSLTCEQGPFKGDTKHGVNRPMGFIWRLL
jgi:hypothetical protein